MKVGDLLKYDDGLLNAIGLCVREAFRDIDGEAVSVMKVLWFDDWQYTDESYPLFKDDKFMEIISPGSSVG
jgi:hypothetical protein